MDPHATTPGPSERIASVDILRGATIAGMLLVNNPGSWGFIYDPLEHAAWNGWTVTDLIFPFFLFLVGVSMMLSFPKRLARGATRGGLLGHVGRRALALMLLGWWGGSWSAVAWSRGAPAAEGLGPLVDLLLKAAWPALVLGAVVLLAGTSRTRLWTGVLAFGAIGVAVGWVATGGDHALFARVAGIRIPGVLVRIGVCYLIASAIWFATPSPRAIVAWTLALLAGYSIFMVHVPIPGFGLPDLSRAFPTTATPPGELFSNWAFWIDYHVLGDHTWSARQLRDASGALIWSFDPEGIVSTFPATASVLLGVLTGQWLTGARPRRDTLLGLLVAGCWLVLAGWLWTGWMPINKRIWTSSYVLFTGGVALLCLGVIYHLVDETGRRIAGAGPRVVLDGFAAYGRNAILAFVGSGMMAVTLGQVQVGDGAGGSRSLKSTIWDALQALPGDERVASLVFAVGFVLVWAVITWFLDRRRIYLKI
jgi:predicted acyltransferase